MTVKVCAVEGTVTLPVDPVCLYTTSVVVVPVLIVGFFNSKVFSSANKDLTEDAVPAFALPPSYDIL